jgi:integrase
MIEPFRVATSCRTRFSQRTPMTTLKGGWPPATHGRRSGNPTEFRRVERFAKVDTHPHALRQYYGSCLLAGGEDIATTARAMGHTVQELLKTYTHVIDKEGGEVSRAARATARAKVTVLMTQPDVRRKWDGADSDVEAEAHTR